jgi:isopenicillin-N epimerase
MLPPPSPLASHWRLDPEVVFLNHGSFGACPAVVMAAQDELRREMEREPVRFLHRELEPRMDAARAELARFVGAAPDDLAFVSNATAGVNTVLNALEFTAGDEILTTDHAYNACRNVLDRVAERSGARVVAVQIPFPIDGGEPIRAALAAAVTRRTRLALVDHVTSPTALVLPIADIVADLQGRGVDVLVDGAHGPAQVPLDLSALGAAYYTGNCHKWLCAPKGTAFLVVRADRQALVHPLITSHGKNSRRTDRSRFRLEFDSTGTLDYTAFLAVPAAIRFLATVVPGGHDEVRRRNHALALEARDLLCKALGVTPPCPDHMLGAMAAVVLPPLPAGARLEPPLFLDPLQVSLMREHGIEVPVFHWPSPELRLVRVAAQLYNSRPQFEHLADALRREGRR